MVWVSGRPDRQPDGQVETGRDIHKDLWMLQATRRQANKALSGFELHANLSPARLLFGNKCRCVATRKLCVCVWAVQLTKKNHQANTQTDPNLPNVPRPLQKTAR